MHHVQDQTEQAIRGYMDAIGLGSWAIQVFLVVLITAILSFVMRRVFERVQRTLERTQTVWDDSIFWALRRPLRAFVWIVGLSFAVQIMQHESGAVIFAAINPLRDIAIITVIAWFLVRFIRRAETNLIESSSADGTSFDRTTVDALAKLLRLSVIITAALVALQTLGFSISGVLAFGGVGGIAVGFAAKDLLSNFFGGLTIYLDRPFAVGDWLLSPDRSIEGVVENIGWRRTLIRKFDTRPLYVPNSTFTNIAVENPSRMNNRLIHETIGVRYEDAAAVRRIVTAVEIMLKTHDGIDGDNLLMVNFNQFAPSSLDFFIWCYTRTTQWALYHTVKQDVLLNILDIIHQHGAEVAYPTSTVHIAQGASTGGGASAPGHGSAGHGSGSTL